LFSIFNQKFQKRLSGINSISRYLGFSLENKKPYEILVLAAQESDTSIHIKKFIGGKTSSFNTYLDLSKNETRGTPLNLFQVY